MLIFIFASCSEEPTQTDVESASNNEAEIGTDHESNETDRAQIKDNLPDNLDFGGQEIRFIHRDDKAELSLEIIAEEQGEVISAAVYQRNLKVEERLNAVIKNIPVKSDIHSGAEIASAVRKSVNAGSDDYDVSVNHMSQSTPLILENMFVNLNKLDYFDFDQPWWANHFMEQITIDGKCYLAAGDVGLSMIQSMYLIFYNKYLFSSVSGDDLYDVVWSGEWTVDKLMDYGKTVYMDLNGDSAVNADDIFGYSTTTIRLIDALLVGADIQLTDRDADGIPYFVIEDNERTYAFIEKINSLLYDSNIAWKVEASAKGEVDMLGKFAEGTVLFIPYTPMGASQLRDMDDDFGILPMPKLNNGQESYTTSVHNGFSAFAVIQTCKYTDIAAGVIEAMCAESYRYVTPAYYETALKIKYSRDDNTSQMLDMIRDSIKFDFGYINSALLNNVMQQFRDLVQKKADAAASSLAASMKICNTRLDELIESYKSLD
ncbi:MAG: hypothetical protein ACYCWE_16310 [Eubacteriales bacterium]